MKQNSIKENLGLNTNFVRKDFCMEKNCGPKKNLGQNFVLFWILVQNKFWVSEKKFGSKKTLGSKEKFKFKKNLGLKTFGSEKNLGPKKFWVKKIFGLKTFVLKES